METDIETVKSEDIEDIEPIETEKPSVIQKSPSLVSTITGTVAGEVRNVFRKTIVLLVGDGFLTPLKVLQTSEVHLKCKGYIFERVTKPMVHYGKGHHYYFVNEGENQTTSIVDLQRDRFKGASDFLANRTKPDFMNFVQKYETAIELEKAKSANKGVTFFMAIVLIGCGMGLMSLIDSAFFEETEGNDITVHGDYNENKNENTNPNEPGKPNDGTVVIQ